MLDLDQDDIEVLEFDYPMLGRLLRDLLGLHEPRAGASNAMLRSVGTIPVHAGLGLPVLLGFPHIEAPIMVHDVPTPVVGELAGAVLTPTGRFIDGIPTGWSSFSLGEFLSVDEHQSIVAHRAAIALIGELKAKALGVSTGIGGIAWPLPVDARWDEIEFEFTADEVLKVRFRGETRRLEPEQLGMKNRKNGRPTYSWLVLRRLCQAGGRLSWKDRDASAEMEKRKQVLSRQLREFFGLKVEPIPWRAAEKAYIAAFRVRRGNLRGRTDSS